MLRERPLKDPSMTLVKLQKIYYWTCTACYWNLSMALSPLTAIEQFAAHICADHSVPTGITNADVPDNTALIAPDPT
jgi:hypothetical protein